MSDVIFHPDLDSAELGTIRLALMTWRSRCNDEAAVMDQLAGEEKPILDPDKARANAAASRKFAAEAEALLDKLQPCGDLRVTVTRPIAEIAGELLDPPAKRTRRELLEERAELLAERVQTNGHGRRARIQEKLDELERELRKLPIEPGEILASSWGYDQTNVDFYRVEKIAGAWLTLQKIAKVEVSDGALSLTGKVLPADPPAPIGEPFRRKRGNDPSDAAGYVKISSHEYARPWDLRPKSVSHYA